MSTQALAEASAPTGNATIATATAATTTAGLFGYAVAGDAKPYIQTSGNATNGVNQLAMAVNSVGLQNLVLGYSVEMISAQPRTIGVVCQFRAGTSGAWTTVTPTVTGSNPYSQAGGTTGLKTTVTATLPAVANNQPVVQVRWAVWRGAETGNSAGLAIDNVTVSAEAAPVDNTSPTLVSVSPLDETGNVLPASNLTVTYNESIAQNAGGSIIIKNGANVVETITLPSALVTISGATATINPTAFLSTATTYTVVFGGQPFKDVTGNLAPALTDETFWNFTTRAQPSVVINQYYEGSGTFDRYIELKNTTNSTVSLSGYRLTVWSDTFPANNEDWKSGTGTTDREVIFADLGTVPSIAPNSTLLIANIGALSPAYAASSANLKGPQVDEATFFSGDDAVVLYFGATNDRANVLDAVSIVGTEGTDTSFYRLTDTPAFTFEAGSKITDDLGQAWQQIAIGLVDAATIANPFYLQAYIDPIPPVLTSFSIGNGAATAVTPRVTLNFASTGGLPTQYQVSESPDFTGASWTAVPGSTPTVELSAGTGVKTLYFKIRNTFGESAVIDDAINRANFTNAGTVIFTQYYEGTSNNKYVEITNTSASTVDLSTWTLVRWGNAEAENWKISNVPSGSSSGVLNLSGTLAAGQTVVLSNNQAASPVAAGSAFISSSIINHTGNDSFGLYEGPVASENLRDALSFTNAGNEGADNSFVRISAGTGFDFTAGTNITGFNTVWQPVTLAVVNAATSNQKEFLGTYLDSVVQDYAAWIGTFYNGVSDPLVIGFNADPDLDGVPNGVEALTGGIPNSPGVFATTELTKTGNTFTFLYPQARVVPLGVTASYEWSTDLINWYTTGQSNGVNTVTLQGLVYDDDNVSPLVVYQVTATSTVGSPAKLFVRVLAEN